MRRNALIFMFALLVGCTNHQTQPTATVPPTAIILPTATVLPTATIPQPIATSVSSPNTESITNMIVNITNADRTALELHEIDDTGQASLKLSLACPKNSCAKTKLHAIPNQPAFALVAGDSAFGGELYQIDYTNWQATTIADRVDQKSLAITPDGSKIAFLRLRTDTTAPVALGSIWVYDFAAQSTSQISEWRAFYADLIWLDNQQLLFSEANVGTPPTDWHTWLLDLNNLEQPRELSAGRIQAIVGEQQLFIEHEQNRTADLNPLIQIERYDLESGSSTPISDWYDRYSQTLKINAAPNQQKAALVAGGEPEMLGMTTPPQLGVELQILQADGTTSQPLFVNCTECYPRWSSKSQIILFFDSNSDQLVLVDAATGTISYKTLSTAFYPHLSTMLIIDK
ncbi:TolB-like translocation protein [Herpetosiphon geysericola]|uniref:Uncharacterized protein n=1 Tax=Herpetosiphon geysericola TaxID=70996 RepID=A0A0P6Z0R3_9CHLR|nr:hypothetical protein [Herpetosiphon geysericola]KPL90927.1 hypothetical protein SE18_03890 [Herpetosiphon geysericola]